MAVSFVYLAFVSLLKLVTRSGRRVDVKDVELLVLRHKLEILRRQDNQRGGLLHGTTSPHPHDATKQGLGTLRPSAPRS